MAVDLVGPVEDLVDLLLVLLADKATTKTMEEGEVVVDMEEVGLVGLVDRVEDMAVRVGLEVDRVEEDMVVRVALVDLVVTVGPEDPVVVLVGLAAPSDTKCRMSFIERTWYEIQDELL